MGAARLTSSEDKGFEPNLGDIRCAPFFAQRLRINELPSSEDRALLATPAADAGARAPAEVHAWKRLPLPRLTAMSGREFR
ncbi:hypothetical protein D7W82_03800 [Corallococcus sp. CA049B]|nr:hypothetical protein D7W82_03800 [Corallococcus sp. CA049B]